MTLTKSGGQQTSIRHFYRGAWGFVVVYSIDNRESFEKAKFYIDDIKKSVMVQPQFGRSQVAIMLVGNKQDLGNSARQVSTSEGKVPLSLFFSLTTIPGISRKRKSIIC